LSNVFYLGDYNIILASNTIQSVTVGVVYTRSIVVIKAFRFAYFSMAILIQLSSNTTVWKPLRHVERSGARYSQLAVSTENPFRKVFYESLYRFLLTTARTFAMLQFSVDLLRETLI